MLNETSFERARTVRSHLNKFQKKTKSLRNKPSGPYWTETQARELLMGPEVAFCKRVLGMDSGNDTMNSLSAADLST